MSETSLLQKLKKWFRENFVFFGPGLLLAITAAGEAGVTEATEIGAHYGLALIWVVLFTLVFKYAFTNGIARYTLATGHTIFDALGRIPGPKYWGSVLIIIVYLVEMLAIGGMLMFAAYFLDYLLPGVYSAVLIALFLLVVALAMLRTNSYEVLELFIAVLVGVLSLAIVISLVEFPIPLNLFLEGVIPTIPAGSEMAILAIIGVVGSGLNLMLYSVWLHEKASRHAEIDKSCDLLNETHFRRYIRSVNVDVLIGFFFVALITISFLFLGYSGYTVSFMGHGATLSLDTLITQVLYIVGSIPYGAYVFLALVAFIFFGAVVVGMDGRARAIAKVIGRVGEDTGRQLPSEHTLYQVMLLVFSGIIIASFVISDPMLIIRRIAAFSAIVFGIFGFIVIYLDLKLPKYARGNRLWLMIMGIGSVISIYVALLLESAFLTYGVPLIERMLVVAFVLYIFSKTQLFRKLLNGTANLLDKFWTVILFGAISIYGTVRGIPVDVGGIIINFRDVGPMIAGLIGGPFIGAAAGAIGGIHRYLEGGPTALPCFAATVLAGVVAGLVIRYWKGRLSMFRAAILAIFVECLHLLVVLPALTIPFGSVTAEGVLNIITITILPMCMVNIAGLLIFAYFVRTYDAFASGTAPLFNLQKFRNDLRELMSPSDEEGDENEEEDNNVR
ncbi:Nramp family divalent metal transporter [Methanorbis furvi]|uniref:Divalent metal cation transporter MntH n=1 Tax=Methanorbis furvi TaxID=3028299 RepID=A0AAE4MCF3_9EURY|nr:Divalent metal cation transporter MntH [Methanocorpusculaceae archaeon Ag1]